MKNKLEFYNSRLGTTPCGKEKYIFVCFSGLLNIFNLEVTSTSSVGLTKLINSLVFI